MDERLKKSIRDAFGTPPEPTPAPVGNDPGMFSLILQAIKQKNAPQAAATPNPPGTELTEEQKALFKNAFR